MTWPRAAATYVVLVAQEKITLLLSTLPFSSTFSTPKNFRLACASAGLECLAPSESLSESESSREPESLAAARVDVHSNAANSADMILVRLIVKNSSRRSLRRASEGLWQTSMFLAPPP